MKTIVVGGGWAGCAASLAARKQGMEVVLVERTDMLLGTGLVGGIMRNNGRYTATEELTAMGGGELFGLIDQNLVHQNIDFPGHSHADLYNIAHIEPEIRNFLAQAGVQISTHTRVTDVRMQEKRIIELTGKKEGQDFEITGDVFIDTTGTAGGPANCTKFGNGCVMCVLRCHSFGGRVSLTARAGVQEMVGRKDSQTGALSGSCKLLKESLSPELQQRLQSAGAAVVPIPDASRLRGKLGLKACQQYALSAYEDNIVLLDTGHAKLMSPFFPLEALREIPGLEHARYEDPYAGGLGNSVRFVAMAPRNDALQVEAVDNLFCAGEKAGLLVGHTEAICTGTLAGFNAARYAAGQDPLILPDSLAIGDAVSHVRGQMQEQGHLEQKFTFSGSVLLQRMRKRGLYTTDTETIADRVEKAGLSGIFAG